jgi:hypothetical protein
LFFDIIANCIINSSQFASIPGSAGQQQQEVVNNLRINFEENQNMLNLFFEIQFFLLIHQNLFFIAIYSSHLHFCDI